MQKRLTCFVTLSANMKNNAKRITSWIIITLRGNYFMVTLSMLIIYKISYKTVFKILEVI